MLKTKTKQQGKQRILFKFPKVLSSVLVCYLYSEQENKNQNIFKVLLILFCTEKKKKTDQVLERKQTTEHGIAEDTVSCME